jgi:hypothetical protein
VVLEPRIKFPMLDLRLFRERSFATPILSTAPQKLCMG